MMLGCPNLANFFLALNTVLPLQAATDYGPYLANEASPLYTTTIVEKCTQKLVEDWNRMRCQVGIDEGLLLSPSRYGMASFSV